MNELFANLGARDRLLLALGGTLVAIALLYGLVWKPLGDRVDALREAVAAQTATHQWMQSAAREIGRLRARQGPARSGAQPSLLSLTDSTARGHGLGPAIRRVEPEGADKVRIQLEQAPFDAMVTWLEQLVGGEGVRIEIITIEVREQPGLVNARLTLQSPGAT